MQKYPKDGETDKTMFADTSKTVRCNQKVKYQRGGGRALLRFYNLQTVPNNPFQGQRITGRKEGCTIQARRKSTQSKIYILQTKRD